MNVLLREKFSLTSTRLHIEGFIAFRGHLKSALEAFTEVCVTLAGIKQLPRHCAIANLEADTVNLLMTNGLVKHNTLLYVYAVAEPLYGLGNPHRRYVAQHFNCSSSIGGLGNCTYNSSVDAQCFIRPHVAGVRCTESKSFDHNYTLPECTILWCPCTI